MKQTQAQRLRERVEVLLKLGRSAEEISETLRIPLHRVQKAIDDIEPDHDKPREATTFAPPPTSRDVQAKGAFQ